MDRHRKQSGLIRRLGSSFDYLAGRTRSVSGPLELVVEVTNRCNQKCIMCPREQSDRPQGLMEVRDFEHLMDDASGVTDFVDLSLGGEPLLHPAVCDLVAAASSRGMTVYLQTNATLLDDRLGCSLIEAGLDLITFSIDAARPETYSRLRPPGPDLRDVEANVETFLKRSRAKGRPYTMVQMVRMEENRNEEDEFIRRWGGPADLVRLKEFNDRAGLVDSSLSGEDDVADASPHPCPRIWRGMAVLWDGQAVPCCLDAHGRHPLGDVHVEGIQGIWNGPRMVELREMHLRHNRQDVELCRECRFPGNRLVDTLAFTVCSPMVSRRLAGIHGNLTRRLMGRRDADR